MWSDRSRPRADREPTDAAMTTTKEVSKLKLLVHILQPDKYPGLYDGFHHVGRITDYPPFGDNK